MTEALYAVIVVVFASLGVLALFNHLVRGSELREAVAEMRHDLQRVEARIVEVRTELESLKFDVDAMEDERVALEQQARCMLDLEESHKADETARLEGGPRPEGGSKGKRDR